MKSMNKHCCQRMEEAVTNTCEDHDDRHECPDCLIDYNYKFNEYGLIIHDGGSSVMTIEFCPWCGSKLPESRRDEWFDEQEKIGITDPQNQALPDKDENGSEEIENLIKDIRSRFEILGPQKCRKESFLAHLRSLGRWEADGGNYPDPGEVTFPENIHISFAVCNQECGIREFIVDGSTQECQRCGDLMFRTDVAEYQFLRKEQD